MSDTARLHLETLAAADSSVELGPVGVAARRTEALQAYESLVNDRGALLRLEPELVQLAKEGLPGAVVYATLLLRQLGRDVTPLRAKYADDRRHCTVMPGGCMGVSHWLCEAVGWASGQPFAHPARLLEYELDGIANASWFELPSPKVLEAARARRGRDGRLAEGNWVFSFAELFVEPAKLRAGGPTLERLLAHPAPAVPIYAALLVREIDRAAGERALAALAHSGGSVLRVVPKRWLPPARSTVLVADLVRELAIWPR
jgi:hypothetical protein